MALKVWAIGNALIQQKYFYETKFWKYIRNALQIEEKIVLPIHQQSKHSKRNLYATIYLFLVAI